MNRPQIIKRVASLAEEIAIASPPATAVLFCLCEALQRGEEADLMELARTYAEKVAQREEQLRKARLN